MFYFDQSAILGTSDQENQFLISPSRVWTSRIF